MKIALILHPFGERESSGIGRMAISLSRALIKAKTGHHFMVFTKDQIPSKDIFDRDGDSWESYAGSGGNFWLSKLLRRSPKADVYIFFTPMMPLFFCPKRSIVFVLDFATFEGPDKAPLFRKIVLKSLYRLALWRASAIIAISEHTRDAVHRIFHTPCEKVSVVYCGKNEVCSAPPRAMEGVTKPFFLFVGAVKGRKNIVNIIRGFAQFVSKTKFTGSLVIAGKKGGKYGKLVDDTINDLGMRDQIIVTGFITDSELSFLYQGALALVSPSRDEGFGMTVVEAMACGVPVIVSTIDVFKEVVGNAGIFVDPENPQEIALAMEKIYTDGGLREDLIKKGVERSATFSWERATHELNGVIEKLVG